MTDPNIVPAEGTAKAGLKLATEVAIANVIDAIEAQYREPDEWESTSLMAAIGCVMGDLFPAAGLLAERALIPPELRAGEWPRTPATATVQQLSNALLRAAGCPAA